MRPSEALGRRLDEVRAVLARYPRLLGSAARGEDGGTSDLGLLVDATEKTSYFDLSALEEELAALLSVPVDILTAGAIEQDTWT